MIKRGLAGLERFTIIEDTPDGPVRRLEACQSPVWDTVLAVVALADAGLPPDHAALTAAAGWLLDEEITGPGDWQVRRPELAPGGWAFEFDNDIYPDIDDTAEVVLALRRAHSPAGPRGDAARASAIERGVRWMVGMQSRDGGWGAFDADNTSPLPPKLPFCDFGAVVPALIAAGVKPGKPAIRRAVAWLEEHQNADGGWGEDMRSYDDPGFAGRGESTASQTAWALLALLAAGEGDSAAPSRAHGTPGLDTTSRPAAPDARQVSTAVERGVQWLTDHQREDGTWDEPQYTGTGFPRDFYLNYHLYRLVFPVTALGRYVAGTS